MGDVEIAGKLPETLDYLFELIGKGGHAFAQIWPVPSCAKFSLECVTTSLYKTPCVGQSERMFGNILVSKEI